MGPKLKKVFASMTLRIYAENGKPATTYQPHNKKDIARLSRTAHIKKFIPEPIKQGYPNLFLFESNCYNRGVVADEFIKKGRIIAEYRGAVTSLEKAVDRHRVKRIIQKIKPALTPSALEKAIDAYIKHVTDYAFEITAKRSPRDSVLAHDMRSIAGFINHNTTAPNIVAEIKNKIIYYKALHSIQKGEQLLVDYGPDYDYPDHLYYIPSTENHLSTGVFLATVIPYYHPAPIYLTANEKAIFGTDNDALMVPQFLYQLLHKKIPTKVSAYEARLPLIEVSRVKNTNHSFDIYVPRIQQHITALMLASSRLDRDAINRLIKIYKVDINAKTMGDMDALIVLIQCCRSQAQFLTLATPIIKLMLAHLDRENTLGSEHFDRTALHMLVDLEWCQAIKLFNHPLVFNVVNIQNFDPLLYAIARGKGLALQALLTIPYIKKKIARHLFIKEEHGSGLQRALSFLSPQKRTTMLKILLSAARRHPKLYKRIQAFNNGGLRRRNRV